MKNELTGNYVASVPAPISPDGRYHGWSDCVEWIDHNIDDLWWYIGEGVFEFTTEQDCLLFMLKWA